MAAPVAREVDIAAIEREIVRLLRLPENTSRNGHPGTRTAVVNLVAFAADRPTMERILETLSALADHHPSRTIVVRVDPEHTGAPIDAWVQVQCKPMGTTGMYACVDQIVIESHPSALRRVPNVILPLLLADLPVVFWWPGEPPLRDPLLFDLLEPANRLVIDTAAFDHVERRLLNLNVLRHRPRTAVDLADLNWGRLLPWRELIAQFWDVRGWQTRLARLTRVEIDLGRPESGRVNRTQGLLLAGWLASRLGWQPIGNERRPDGYSLTARVRRSTIEIATRDVEASESELAAVRFLCEHRGKTTVFSIVAHGDGAGTMSVVEGDDPPSYSRICRLESFQEPELLAVELDLSQGDMIFEHALGAVSGFLTATGGR